MLLRTEIHSGWTVRIPIYVRTDGIDAINKFADTLPQSVTQSVIVVLCMCRSIFFFADSVFFVHWWDLTIHSYLCLLRGCDCVSVYVEITDYSNFPFSDSRHSVNRMRTRTTHSGPSANSLSLSWKSCEWKVRVKAFHMELLSIFNLNL